MGECFIAKTGYHALYEETRGWGFVAMHDGHREKMRLRFLNTGLAGFADHEALELLLYYTIPRQDTNPIAHRLMERYGSLSAVLSAPMEDLQKVEGVGKRGAVLLNLIPQLNQKARLATVGQDTILNSTEKAGRYLLERFAGEKNEVIYQLCLDRKGKLVACKRLGEGGASAADLNVRKMIENAILSSASAVILAHNHPSGIALPSQEDYVTTRRVKTALSAIGVTLIDHIIVADEDFVSLADSGFLSD